MSRAARPGWAQKTSLDRDAVVHERLAALRCGDVPRLVRTDLLSVDEQSGRLVVEPGAEEVHVFDRVLTVNEAARLVDELAKLLDLLDEQVSAPEPVGGAQ